jgi:hypothetical protein
MSSESKIPAYQKWYLMLNQKADVEFGRPRMRWLHDVEADIKALSVKRWRI